MASFPGQNRTGTPVPNAPLNLVVGTVTTNSVALSWSVPVGGALSYNVYRNFTRIAAAVIALSFSDSGLSPSTSYTYYVTSVSTVGEGNRSNTTVATTGSSTQLKYTPGHWSGYSSTLGGATAWVGSSAKAEFDATTAFALVKGHLLGSTWGWFEPVQGETDTNATYPFGYATGMGKFKTVLDYARGFGKKIAPKIILGSYTTTHPGTNDGGIVPLYIQNDPAYGAAGYRVAGVVTNLSTHGLWGGDGNGNTYACCFHRTAIRDRLIKLVQAILLYFDGDPVLESVQFDEDSFVIGASSTNACPDWNNTNFTNNAINLIQTLNTGTRTTEVSWEATFGGTPTDSQKVIAQATANLTDWSGTDTLGQTYVNAHSGAPLTWGANIMCGGTSGGTLPAVNYRDQGFALYPEVEGSDMGAFNFFNHTEAPAITFTSAPSGATGGTLTSPWPFSSASHTVTFSDSSTRSVAFTVGLTAVTWTVALGTVTANANCASFSEHGYTPYDILQCHNLTLDSRKAYWGVMTGTAANWGNTVQPTGLWSALGPFLNDPANALVTTSRPSNYP